MTEFNVNKRNGTKEKFDLNKIHKVLEWATEDIAGVSISEIEIRANIQLYDGIPAYSIHELLIKSAAELIDEHNPNYQFVAARLINYKLRKEVYGQFNPPALNQIVCDNIAAGVYDSDIFDLYTTADIHHLDSIVKHDRDWTFTYAGMEQLRSKYLVQNRSTGQLYETPQVAYVLIAATLFAKYPTNTRMQYIKRFYDAISKFFISLPTPIMAGVRTPTKQFSSCVLIESGDSLDSINATASAVVKYISKKAGIGLGVGAIRALGSSIGDGSVKHTGVIPFLKYFQSAVKSCSQGGVRGGAATAYYPAWHLEFEDLIVLKNNKGTESNRVRQLDYAVQFNKLMYTRVMQGGNITLFSPQEVPGLLDAFYEDQDEFQRLYEQYEQDDNIRKTTVSALDLFSSFITERKDTGRIYLQNVDHANEHGSFLPAAAPIRMSNLCVAGDTQLDVVVDGAVQYDVAMSEVVDLVQDGHDVQTYSYNTEDLMYEYKLVTAAKKMSDKAEVLRITDDATGKSIRCTADHPIYTKNRGYVVAGELNEADELLIL